MPKIIDQIKESGAHYTPNELSKFLAKKLLAHFNAPKKMEEVRALDPACGDGELLLALAQENPDFPLHLTGVDSNPDALILAENRLKEVNVHNYNLEFGDFLEKVNVEEDNLFNLDTGIHNEDLVDMIIANPPYVRTQVLGSEKSKELGVKFNLKGRVDLYQAFLVAMTQKLKPEGLICVITSNRYLTTSGGKDTREFLDCNYEILEVIDLGDTKLFSAAVLPAIFIGRKKDNQSAKQNKDVPFFKVYESSKEEVAIKCNTIFEILEKKESGLYETNQKKYDVTVGVLTIPDDSKDLWVMASQEDKLWSSEIKKNAYNTFDDVFKVKVGIKSTADKIFIKNWAQLDSNIKPEEELLKPLISSSNASRWAISKDKEALTILYPHKVVSGKRTAISLDLYPKAKAYLELNRKELEKRTYLTKSKTRHWYELWVPQDPAGWASPKVVFPDISSEARFLIDTEGYLVDGNCYWLSLKNKSDEDLLYLATGVANSKLMEKFHSIEFQNVLYAKKKRYLTQYVKKYPLPNPSSKESQEIIRLTKELVSIQDEIRIKELEDKIEVAVEQAFNVFK